jgi:hypothetical protein
MKTSPIEIYKKKSKALVVQISISLLCIVYIWFASSGEIGMSFFCIPVVVLLQKFFDLYYLKWWAVLCKCATCNKSLDSFFTRLKQRSFINFCPYCGESVSKMRDITDNDLKEFRELKYDPKSILRRLTFIHGIPILALLQLSFLKNFDLNSYKFVSEASFYIILFTSTIIPALLARRLNFNIAVLLNLVFCILGVVEMGIVWLVFPLIIISVFIFRNLINEVFHFFLKKKLMNNY